MSIPMNWSWILATEAAIMVVLVRRLLNRFDRFRSKRTEAPGWRRATEAVIAVTLLGFGVAGRSRPPKESFSVLGGLVLGCVIDELIQARTSSATNSSTPASDASNRGAFIAPSDSKLFR